MSWLGISVKDYSLCLIDSAFLWYNLGHAEKIQAEHYLHKFQIKSFKNTITGQLMYNLHHTLSMETVLHLFCDTFFPNTMHLGRD